MEQEPRVLAGRYEVGAVIGRGGMAEVHIGQDTRLSRAVAIKVLRPDLARDPSFQARFRREAQSAAALNHPSIVAVYDTGEDTVVMPTGVTVQVPFIVMEYVEGRTVRDILSSGSALHIDEAIEITVGVLSALEYSHQAGIVHRDIKPANVMMTPTGAIKVMDFGIARAVADSAATMTQTSAVIGTAQYLSPEQARGETVDSRSDLYSTGCLLFELLTGRAPFVGESPVSVAYQHVREPAPLASSIASDVPEVLDRIVAKSLAKDREHRYSTAGEFRADLEAALRGGAVAAPAVVAGAGGFDTELVPAGVAAAGFSTQVLPTDGAPATTPGGWGTVGNTEQNLPTDLYEDEEEVPNRWWIWAVLGAVVLGAAILVISLLMGGGNQGPVQQQVPEVENLTEAEATDLLETEPYLFEVTVTSEASDTIPVGNAIGTKPRAGELLAEGSPIELVISAGQDVVAVPDVSGMTESSARIALEGADLVVREVLEENSPEQTQGRVIETDPLDGVEVPRGSEVTVYVASGQVELPELAGMSEQEASQTLLDLKLIPRVSTEVVTNEDQIGQVLRQDRAAGLVPQGTSVEIIVGAESTTYEIPSGLVGLSPDEAEALLEAGALVVRSEFESSFNTEGIAEGLVARTFPEAGAEVERGTQITFYVSRGPRTYTVPNVTGQSEQDARNSLNSAGFFNIRTEDRNTPDSSLDGTVDRVNPSANTQVDDANTQITLTIFRFQDTGGGGGGGGGEGEGEGGGDGDG